MEWFSVPSAKPEGFNDSKGKKTVRFNKKLRDEVEMIFVQKSSASPIIADKVEGKDVTFSIAAWEDAAIIPEELESTLLAYPRTFYALPKELLGEEFTDRLDKIEIKINDALISQLEQLKKSNLGDAQKILKMLDEAGDDEAKMTALMTPENIAMIEKFSDIRTDDDQNPLQRRLLEAHYGMPEGHLRHMPSFHIKDEYSRLEAEKKRVAATVDYRSMLKPEDDEDEPKEATAKKGSGSRPKRTTKA